MGYLIFFLLLAFCLAVAAASIKVVKQSEVKIIERFGKYSFTAEAGLNIILPFVDKVRAVVSLKQQTMDVTPQSVITKDNVTITIDTVVFYQIMDPVKAVYEIESLQKGIAYIAITTIRDIVCKVDRVEIKDIKPPADIRDAMEKQMNAERNKRAIILEAEGKRQADITLAEGNKQATILNAEAERESSIRKAQGIRESKILEAEGNAQAIKKVAEAKAEEIRMVYGAIMESKPDEKLVAIKSLEALEKVSNGTANKVFIPFDATKAMGALGAMSEVVEDKKTSKK